MLLSCPRSRRRPSLALGAAAVGLGWGATVAALGWGATVAVLSSGARGSGFLKSCAIKGLAWTKALMNLSMSCSEGLGPEGPESEPRYSQSWVCLLG